MSKIWNTLYVTSVCVIFFRIFYLISHHTFNSSHTKIAIVTTDYLHRYMLIF